MRTCHLEGKCELLGPRDFQAKPTVCAEAGEDDGQLGALKASVLGRWEPGRQPEKAGRAVGAGPRGALWAS